MLVYSFYFLKHEKKKAEDGKTRTFSVWNMSFCIILLHWAEVQLPGQEEDWMMRPRKRFPACIVNVAEGEGLGASTAALQSRHAHSSKPGKEGEGFFKLSVDTV